MKSTKALLLACSLIITALVVSAITGTVAVKAHTQAPQKTTTPNPIYLPMLILPRDSSVTPTVAPSQTPTATPSLTPTPIPTVTVSPSPTPTPDLPPGQSLIIDHGAIADFDRIPDTYIRAAADLMMLFRHASVGGNINDGLDCLMNNFDVRPSHCDRGLSPDEIFYDPKYDRSNWRFEYHSENNPNPGWWNKENFFIERVDNLGPNEPYEVVGFKFGYVDATTGSNIADKFFNNDPGDNLPSIEDLEQMEVNHPDKIHMWWTMGLARAIGTVESESFNQQMRAYAAANGKILMDIADIESHRPDGSPCYDNGGRGIEALCDEYTEEVNGGHLNARGKQRMAKAVWVMMARIAGWDGRNQ